MAMRDNDIGEHSLRGFLASLALDRDLGVQEYRVMACLIPVMIRYANAWQSISQAEIGSELGLHGSNVDQAIEVLVRKEFLLKTIGSNGRNAYRLNLKKPAAV